MKLALKLVNANNGKLVRFNKTARTLLELDNFTHIQFDDIDSNGNFSGKFVVKDEEDDAEDNEE